MWKPDWRRNGHWTSRAISTHGRCRTDAAGSTGSCAPKRGYGSATVSQDNFIGFHAHGGQYNIGGVKNGISFLGSDLSKLSDYRYQGWFIGAGVAYGYAWILGRHWNLEAEIGVGYAYTQYDSFRCVGCGKRVEKDKPHHYVGPTKAAVNLVYVF